MLILDLKRLFRLKGIEKPIGWMMKEGITNDTAHKLLHGKFKRGVPMHHLMMICEKLWCTPNDLYVWKPDNAADDNPQHPLQVLKRKESKENINDLIKRLPPDKMEEVSRMIKEKSMG